MVLNPNKAKTKIEFTHEGDVQPNGIDLRLGKVYTYVKEEDYFLLSEDKKHTRKLVEIQPEVDGYYVLDKGYYLIEFENFAKIGTNETGWVFPRSTLMRNGIVIHTALYDSSYSGPMCAGLSINSKAYIAKGTRIAQFVTLSADANGSYNGQYQDGSKII